MTDPAGGLVALRAGDTQYVFDAPNAKLIEVFPNPSHPEKGGNPVMGGMRVRIDTSEFTSLCPVTGQPDYGRIIIEYEPEESCLESKSFKLYLMGFRNHGCFAEAVATMIGNDLVRALRPKWLTVECEFTPRGGISFWPLFEYQAQRDGVWSDEDEI